MSQDDLTTENAALHQYRERIQAEVVALARTFHDLARDASIQLDQNGPALAFHAGAHAAYLVACRVAERVLLLAEEAADQVINGKPDCAAWLCSDPNCSIQRPHTLQSGCERDLLIGKPDDVMQHGVPPEGPGLHEAQDWTANYQLRHVTHAQALGVWRWRGMDRHRDRITALVADATKRGMVIDFGGADGPLGMGSRIVDTLSDDLRSLDQVPIGAASGVFTSHTLEHVPDLRETLRVIHGKLMPGGWLIAHVPVYTCERWRAGVHESARHGQHVWTFGLEDEQPINGLHQYRNIAREITDAGFRVELAQYCGDDSAMIIAFRESPGE